MIVIGCFVFIIYIPNMQTSEKNVMIGIGKVEKKDPLLTNLNNKNIRKEYHTVVYSTLY